MAGVSIGFAAPASGASGTLSAPTALTPPVSIEQALPPGGRFAGQLFGERDEWADDTAMTFFTATQALRILRDHTPPARIPVELPRNFSYLINLPVALQLGRYPPLKLLDVAEIVGIQAEDR